MPPLSHRPFYRTTLQETWTNTWKERRLWIVAVIAGILQTGGIVDVLLRLLREHLATIPTLREFPIASAGQMILQVIRGGDTVFAQTVIGLKLLQVAFLATLFAATILSLAVLCQGVLVYVVGVRGRFTRPTLQEAFSVAGSRFWGVAALNLLPIAAYVGGWFVFLGPFGTLIPLTSVAAIVAYVVAAIFALILGFIATTLHLLAMQRVVLDGAHVMLALQEAWQIIRRSWFVILETALGMFALGVALFVASAAACLILILPLLAVVGAAIVFQSPLVMNGILLLCEFIFIMVMVGVGGFMITFQYTIWNRLFTRLNKDMAVAKVVRVVHAFLGRFQSLKPRS